MSDQLEIDYHDHEWGVPVLDDETLFEFFVLESFQAGLSWNTILHKRENFRKAFAGFDAKKIARFSEKKVELLMQDTGIIRNRLKINCTIKNAELFLGIQKEFGSFVEYLWSFVGGKTIINRLSPEDFPATSPESDAMAKDLKKRGFKFCGSTICYALMQATGMVNDHTVDCFRYKECKKIAKK